MLLYVATKYDICMFNRIWNRSIDNTSAKVNRTSAFICRNLKDCSAAVQSHCFKTLARPVAEFASPIWDPNCQTHIDALEASQRRAVRRILKDYDRTSSATALLENLDLEPLQQRRKIEKAAILNLNLNILKSSVGFDNYRQLWWWRNILTEILSVWLYQ